MFGGGLTGLSLALTTIPFGSAEAASAWIEANRFDMAYTSKLEEEDDHKEHGMDGR